MFEPRNQSGQHAHVSSDDVSERAQREQLCSEEKACTRGAESEKCSNFLQHSQTHALKKSDVMDPSIPRTPISCESVQLLLLLHNTIQYEELHESLGRRVEIIHFDPA